MQHHTQLPVCLRPLIGADTLLFYPDLVGLFGSVTTYIDSITIACNISSSSTKRDEIRAEHLLEQAAEDLRVLWKAWLKENGPGKGGPAAAVMAPAAGVTSLKRK